MEKAFKIDKVAKNRVKAGVTAVIFLTMFQTFGRRVH